MIEKNVTAYREAFVTLKDHKENFRNKPTCRLIKPCKPELRKVSKQIGENINRNVRAKTNMNQWKNTNDVKNWFKNIKNKADHTMIFFDICDFYSSVTNTLLQKALKFASKYSTISKEDIDIITHTKRTTLYKDGQPWEEITSKFNVTMGSYDGAEICELVGLYPLSQMQALNINIGLYRDDGLATTRQTPREVEMTKKKLCKIFRENDLRITVEANKTVADFLDITLNLRTGAYKPYKKNPMKQQNHTTAP